ncbi:MAG: FKBP-type peptidyl-prolyl cis-trans isomerase [Marinilabiliaceae bacterium]|nr:FKBP-type peptidyl-prolyl cis-trans isomerase [Marinilabiliaceae bacterium]
MKFFLNSVFLFFFILPVLSQHIPEEARIKQFVNANYKGVEPRMSGLYIIKQNETDGKIVKPGDEVTVHYEGKLLNDNVFDSSYKRMQPIKFIVGTGRVIAGWDEGVSLMRQGEKAVLIIPSHLAYGDRNVGSIPANSPLVFTIEVLKVGK